MAPAVGSTINKKKRPFSVHDESPDASKKRNIASNESQQEVASRMTSVLLPPSSPLSRTRVTQTIATATKIIHESTQSNGMLMEEQPPQMRQVTFASHVQNFHPNNDHNNQRVAVSNIKNMPVPTRTTQQQQKQSHDPKSKLQQTHQPKQSPSSWITFFVFLFLLVLITFTAGLFFNERMEHTLHVLQFQSQHSHTLRQHHINTEQTIETYQNELESARYELRVQGRQIAATKAYCRTQLEELERLVEERAKERAMK